MNNVDPNLNNFNNSNNSTNTPPPLHDLSQMTRQLTSVNPRNGLSAHKGFERSFQAPGMNMYPSSQWDVHEYLQSLQGKFK
jgi:hypothetical protein